MALNRRLPELAVAVGGALGALARYELGALLPDRPWPVAVFAINASGAFLIGLILTTALESRNLEPWLRLGLTTGLLGGYTTFSGFAAGLLALARAGEAGAALGYAVATLAGGLGATFAGAVFARGLAVTLERAAVARARRGQGLEAGERRSAER